MRAVVFHRDGITVLESRAAEHAVPFAQRVADELAARAGATAIVDVIGHGAAVLDWLRGRKLKAAGFNPAARELALAETGPPAEAERVAITVTLSGNAVMIDDVKFLLEKIGSRPRGDDPHGPGIRLDWA